MTWVQWRRWAAAQPWTVKWFIALILIRPVMDPLYFLKNISPYLSPLNIAGAATLLFIIMSYLSRRLPRAEWTRPDYAMGLWTLLVLMNAAAVLIYFPNAGGVELVIKSVIPPMLYFYLRRIIRSKTQLVGVLTTFLYSAAIPIGMLLFERFVRPLGTTIVTRGYVRYEGIYADVMSYAMYISATLLIAGYFYLNNGVPAFSRNRVAKLAAIGVVTLVGLMTMHHGASWGVCIALGVLLFLHHMRARDLPALGGLALLAVAAFLVAGDDLMARVGAMYQNDLRALGGEIETYRMFHGRAARWARYLALWEPLSPFAKLFGVSFAWVQQLRAMLAGMHNDYLRIMFATGMVGLTVYLLFYVQLLLSSLSLARCDRFLVRGSIALMLLYSVTTVPTTYFNLLYVCLSIMAYAALPRALERTVREYQPVGRPQRLMGFDYYAPPAGTQHGVSAEWRA